MKFTKLISPFFFALSSVVSIYTFASVISSPDQMVRVMIFYVSLLIALIFPAYWITNNWDWTGILLALVAISFLSSPAIFRAQVTMVITVFVIWFAYLYIKKIRLRIYHVIASLNLSGGAFLILVTSTLFRQMLVMPVNEFPQFYWQKRTLDAHLNFPDELPDIYYIVLDGYGRADILQDYFEYDNSDFLGELRDRGFFVPTNAHSNYPKTILSIPSTLNMNYISALAPQLDDSDTYYWWLMRPMVKHSDVRILLEDIGYRSYSVTTGWGPTDNPTTDVYYQPAPIVISDLETVVLADTPLNAISSLLSKFSYVPSFAAHHDLVLFNFSSIVAASKDMGPKFVFAHIISPHPPFVFDEDGELLTPKYEYSFSDASDIDITDEEYRESYVSQMKFVNKKIITLVDEIIKNSDVPSIIILQADHGPGSMTDFVSSENTCLRERYSIFAAYYLPGADQAVIPDDLTPVNLFRIVFNEYFGTNYPLLPNKHYYVDGIYLYKGEDVSSIIDTCSVR